MYPDIWGAGALFAASGLDFVVDYHNQLAGILMGDRIGVRFYTEPSSEIYISLKYEQFTKLVWQIVASDIIYGKMSNEKGENAEIVFSFVSSNSIIGKCPVGTFRAIVGEEKIMKVTDSCMIDGHSFDLALNSDGEHDFFMFSYDKKSHYVSALDVEKTILEKKAFFDNIQKPAIKNQRVARTLAKTLSIMKSQVYSPQGMFKQRWTTPDRLPHKALWLWDSIFHSIGNFYIEPTLARDSIYSVLDSELENGFIPHRADPDKRSNITQPPVIAWGVLSLIKKTGKKEWFEDRLDKISAYLEWDIRERSTPDGMFHWCIEDTGENCACAESGMDNSSRFDVIVEMDHIDFTGFMLNEYEAMISLCEIYGRDKEKAIWVARYNQLKEKMQTLLWDSKQNFFYDRICSTKEFSKVKSIASYIPLFAGACTEEQAEYLVRSLNDEKDFGTPLPCPSLSITDPTFGTDMWRGPVWINYVYFICNGLIRYGYKNLAKNIIKKVVYELVRWYENEGVFFEYYDNNMQKTPKRLRRKGDPVEPGNLIITDQSIRDYGWSASLFAAMVYENPEIF
mgnify:FL=1